MSDKKPPERGPFEVYASDMDQPNNANWVGEACEFEVEEGENELVMGSVPEGAKAITLEILVIRDPEVSFDVIKFMASFRAIADNGPGGKWSELETFARFHGRRPEQVMVTKSVMIPLDYVGLVAGQHFHLIWAFARLKAHDTDVLRFHRLRVEFYE